MFDELSSAIAKLIKDNKITGPQGDVEVSFDRPSEPYPKHDSPGLVNAFLYDVREETTLRSNELSFQRSNGWVDVGSAPFFVTCSYLMTAWVHPAGPMQEVSLSEQRILRQLMQMLASQTEIPVPQPGAPPKDPLLVPAQISTVDEKGGLSEFWTAVGNKIRPSFVLKATVPLEAAYAAKTPIKAATSLSVGIGADEKPESILDRDYVNRQELQPGLDWRHTIGGRVTNDKGKPQERITVKIVELHRQTETDMDGRYVFSNVPEGNYTISVSPTSGASPTDRRVELHTRLESEQSYDFGAPPSN
jgi:Pvc16 N-terminal domain/Carboxypeptidase regulatory-like domain